jgi:DNA helicase HerA-like ATPase
MYWGYQMSLNDTNIGRVLKSNSQFITVEIVDKVIGTEKKSAQAIFEEHKESLQVGDYLRIAQGNRDSVIAVITNIGGISTEESPVQWKFLIECQPIGTLSDDNEFGRGGALLPVPLEPVYVLDTNVIHGIFSDGGNYNFLLGKLSMNKEVDVLLDGDKFFSKHIAVVGSTGSGKSCTVTKILHEVVGITLQAENKHRDDKRNSHIIIFDIHSEYEAAFSLKEEQNFTLNTLSVDNLKLPYWLMNSEELEALFIESNEANSHNQVSQFKKAVILNKQKYNSQVADTITYDTPVYFSIQEVCNFIENMNREVIGRLEGENLPKLADGALVEDRAAHYFDDICEFVPYSNAKADKANNGPFHGEFNRFVSRLETRLADKRLDFLLAPTKEGNIEYKSEDFAEILQQYLGYLDKSNVTIVDLSGIPFEVLSITISLISRIVFDFCFHYSKLRHSNGNTNDVPVMIVCEEAHNYVPQNDGAAYKPSRKSIERVAKEGRKYGLSLMVVSQRPSEVSETIFAQCTNFIAMRLTNTNDQMYIRRLLPDNLSSVTSTLPNLADGECVVMGDAIALPSVVQIDKPNPEPKSQSVRFHKEWLDEWKDITFSGVIERWKKY